MGSLKQRSVRLGCDAERHPASHLAALDRLISTMADCRKAMLTEVVFQKKKWLLTKNDLQTTSVLIVFSVT